MALWQSTLKPTSMNVEVYIPAGFYKITREIRYTNNMRTTLRGAGMLQSALKFKDITNFSATPDYGVKCLLYMYRVGGIPTLISDLGFWGEAEYTPFPNNVNLVVCANTNAVHFDRCWFTSAKIGLFIEDHNSDFFLTNSTSEYCVTVLKSGVTDTITINDNNFWQSAEGGERYTAIDSTGRCFIRNNNFYVFRNTSVVVGPKSQVCDNFFASNNYIGVATLGEDSIFSGNTVETSGGAGMQLTISSGCVVSSNQFVLSASSWGCINLRKNTTLNKGSLIQGNIFNVNSPQLESGTGIIIAENPGSSYSTGATNCMIANNIFTKNSSTLPDVVVDQTNNTIINNLTNI